MAVNLRHGTDGFTSPPKEGVLTIFFRPEKSWRLRPGLNPRTCLPKASTLPLDHRKPLCTVFISSLYIPLPSYKRFVPDCSHSMHSLKKKNASPFQMALIATFISGKHNQSDGWRHNFSTIELSRETNSSPCTVDWWRKFKFPRICFVGQIEISYLVWENGVKNLGELLRNGEDITS